MARGHGVEVVAGRAERLPFPDETFDVVLAGEILEHVADTEAVVAEACRVLAPGGTVVIDTIADNLWARLSLVTIGERLAGGPPRGCHDPALFVNPRDLRRMFAAHGVTLRIRGLSPHPLQYLRYLATRRGAVRMRTTALALALYQGVGVKAASA